MAIKISEDNSVVIYENEPDNSRALFPNITDGGSYTIERGEKTVTNAGIWSIEFSGTHDRLPDIFVIANENLVGAAEADISGYMFGAYTGITHLLGIDPIYMYSSAPAGVGIEEFTVKKSRVSRPEQVFYSEDSTDMNLRLDGYHVGSTYLSTGTYKWIAIWFD